MEIDKEILEKIISIKDYSFQKEKAIKIIEGLIPVINQNIGTINASIQKDYKECQTNVSIDELRKTITKYKTENIILNQEYKNKQVDGYGNIGVIYDGDLAVTIALAMMALRTHNNIVFFTENMINTNKEILKLISQVIEKNDYTNNVFVMEANYKCFIENQEKFDLGILIGNKYEMSKIESKFNLPIIYNGYKNIMIYADDSYFKNTLKQMDEFAYQNNINIEYFNDKDIDKDLKKINEWQVNDSAGIFTKDYKKAYEFLSKVKAKRVYVNVNPFLEYSFEFDEKEMLLNKKIIMG